MKNKIEVPALRIVQGIDRILYSFAVDGKILHEFAAISRISRDEDAKLDGYQRTEMLSHIGEIKAYLESDNPMIPNALVIAFDDSISFVPVLSLIHI